MNDRELIEYLNREIQFISDYSRLNNKQRIHYLNKIKIDKISLLIPALIRLINDKHCS